MSDDDHEAENGPAVPPALTEPTFVYPHGEHPLQEQIEWAVTRFGRPDGAVVYRSSDTYDEAEEAAHAVVRAFTAIRWIDYDAARYVATPSFDMAGQSSATLQQSIRDFVDTVSRLDDMYQEANGAARVVRLVRELPQIARWFEHNAPLRVFSRHIESPTSGFVVDLRQRLKADIDELTQDASQALSEVDADLVRARKAQTDYAAVLEELTEQQQRIEDQLTSNATAVLQGSYAGVASSAKKSRNWAIVVLLAVLVLGVVVLGLVFLYWNEEYGAGTEGNITGNDMLILFALKAPLVVVWLWLFRIATRQVSAATHRRAIAEAKQAALQTWEALAGSSERAKDMVLPLLADHVLDPTKTGILDDHRDSVSVGLSRFAFNEGSASK